MDNLSPITVARFWSKVDVMPSTQDCWEWQGCRKAKGYGRFRIPGSRRHTENAHRIAYSLVNGKIPTGLLIRHKCDNPRCCNPAHLETGTIADNSRDMVERGLSHLMGSSSPGESNPASKLTESQVTEIRERIAAGATNVAIAKAFGVHHATISCIRLGKTWAA